MQIHRGFLAAPHQLDMDAVERAGGTGEPVGSCDCGGYLHVEGPPCQTRVGRGPVWVQLVCRGCGRDIACPDGRLAARWRRGGSAA